MDDSGKVEKVTWDNGCDLCDDGCKTVTADICTVDLCSLSTNTTNTTNRDTTGNNSTNNNNSTDTSNSTDTNNSTNTTPTTPTTPTNTPDLNMLSDCDPKVYVSWIGKDKDGNYLMSASYRISQFRKYSLYASYNSAKKSF